jgi:hypothetical protein
MTEADVAAVDPGAMDDAGHEVAATSDPSPAIPLPLAAIRDLLVKAHPDVVPELIQGTTYEELLAALPAARAAYARAAEQARRGSAHAAVPAGGGVRTPPVNADALSPYAKIRVGLGK